MTRKKIVNILRHKFPYLKDNFGVKKIGLFGSFVKGIARKDSDIDIFIEFEKPIGFKFIELAQYLERLFSKRVDILTLEGVRGIRLKKVAADIRKSIFYV